MRELQLEDVEAQLSALVDDVRRGEEIFIMRQGCPEAVIISWKAYSRLSNVSSFIRLLAASPLEDGDLPPRDASPVRDALL